MRASAPTGQTPLGESLMPTPTATPTALPLAERLQQAEVQATSGSGTGLSIFDDSNTLHDKRGDDERLAYDRLRKRVTRLTWLFITSCVVMALLGTILVTEKPKDDKRGYGDQTKTNEGTFGTASGGGGNTTQAEIRICTRKQAFLVWIDGHLVGTGKECDFHFLAPKIKFHAPCSKPLLLAFEGQDFEYNDLQKSGESKGGFVAEIRWCGRVILTDSSWSCSTVADYNWQTKYWVPQKLCSGPPPPPGTRRVSKENFQPALYENHTCGELSGACGDATEAADNNQARKKHINPAAKWIWAGKANSDFVDVDSAYCRLNVNCTSGSCNRTIPVSQGCQGPGITETGAWWTEGRYVIRNGYKEPTQFSQTGLMKPEELGQIKCNAGFAAMRTPKAICHEFWAQDKEKPPKFEFDGCCPDFLWHFPSTNWLVGLSAFSLMLWVFTAFHIVCDDFFVPALNVMCEKVGLSDDIAGATFMAAGASSPELFASLIGVLTHSAVGVGTVVGSELFNMLVIIGGVCLVTPKPLLLDWRPMSREVFFFGLSLIGVLLVLADSEVELYEASLLLSGYALYVLVMAFFKPIVKLCCPRTGLEDGDDEDGVGVGQDYYSYSPQLDGADQSRMEYSPRLDDEVPDVAKNQFISEGNGAMIQDVDLDHNVIAHGFLHKKSEFHSKTRNSSETWQQRWMILDSDSFRYIRKNGKESVIVGSPADWVDCSVMATSYTEFVLNSPSGMRAQTTFKAAKPIMARQWAKQLNNRIVECKAMSPRKGDAVQGAQAEQEAEHHDILAMPKGGGFPVFMFIATFPVLFCLKYSVPDVRNPKYTNCYPATMFISVIWLAFLAEFMMNSAESCGCIANISEDIMGLTFTAAGTSLPNLFASIIVAKQGLGNMSVSNAFGSNTFNIFIALALPWFIGGMINAERKDMPYSYHVPAGSIFLSCQILGVVLAGIVLTIVVSNMRLTKVLAYPFLFTYVAIMAGLISQA